MFVRARAPFRPLSAHGTISVIVARTMARAGIHPPIRGAHVLTRRRNGIASVWCGSFSHSPLVGDIRKVSLWLGHSSIRCTEMYTRADPTEKPETPEAITPTSLRRGRSQPPDRVMALLKEM